ncbi:MAG: amidase [Comamonas sp.]|uniref:amidase n=1 Tax=Comamonas sp. TaxID=34028 RepID=UPI002FCC32A9
MQHPDPDSLVARAPSAVATRSALLEGRQTAQQVATEFLERVAQAEPAIHAWQHLDAAQVLRQASALDQALAGGRPAGPLAGVPVAVKDIFDTQDMPTGYGSAVYASHRPGADADVVAALRSAGGIVAGKTVSTEFAYFAPGPTANPWDTRRTPGGSSSGSAAAVASGMVPVAFGSQTAGSLIRPASYCGVFALKPSHASVSTRGAKPFSESLDTVGWLANDADDLELVRAALAGIPYAALPARAASGLRLGVWRTHEWSYADTSGQQAWETGVQCLARAGVEIVETGLAPEYAPLIEAQKTVMAYEAARALADDIARHGDALSLHIRELAARGRAIGAQEYREALDFAARGRQAAAAMLQDIDALVVPAAPGEAPCGLDATGDPVFSRVWTLLGLPSVNVPGLLGPNGMPVGLQLVGNLGTERALLALAKTVHPVLQQAAQQQGQARALPCQAPQPTVTAGLRL